MLWLVGALAAAAAGFVLVGYLNATAPPVVRRLNLTVAGYPAGARPLRILLFSDVHVHGPDMPPFRVARLVEQMNSLHADIDVATGDFVGNSRIGRSYSIAESIAPLAGLKAPLGVYAVLGNNDHRAGAPQVTRALESAGVRVLVNEARRVGPLAIGGMDGRLYKRKAWQEARQRTYDALDRTPGVKILLAHRPDEFAHAPTSISLVLAGHTHCGQIVLPLIGPLGTGSDFGREYLCGVVRRGWQVLTVTAGLGTSYVPLRIGAPPDVWLITVAGPQPRSNASQ
jgi:predicted MPP superfamily phosphohydrolase